MGLLNGATFYLAGPIDRVNDSGIRWRRWITPILKEMNIRVIDPTDKPIDRGLELNHGERENLIEEGKFTELANIMREIRCIDLRCVDKADAIIVNYDIDVHMCGTMEEIFIANRQKKPILIHFNQGIKKIPYWMWGVLPYEFFFEEWSTLLDYIIWVDAGKPCHKRWVLFDWSKI